MSGTYETQQRWLDERFNHVKTILSTIQRTVEEVKESHSRCANRCNTEMGEVYHRLRDVEHRLAARNGADEHKKEAKRSRNLTWQMIIAMGTALSAVGVFLGYMMGKG